ncbi:MAG: chromosome segregation protein SMC [Verrucomicrobia bacterium]|nr:chromosome segregation protein SMC [Verrucomicrobiota bacterium]
MYLKSLELIGFKSFVHKTTLNLHRGVTAIVGPNGCGKSNVLDAIRWVLGEQSAKALRGGEMADVIFSGTDSKQAVGMAEVSLTFADCEKELGTDYHEVCVTRRVYRDGGSDYLLNKTACRLKDIQMLFMDTGIGRSAYSIMEQGKIDLILSSRPEDRRAIFEEAAGITKYKAQKKEALRKLEFTDANLVRLADIMKEVKRQIGSLLRQANKARRYKALLEEVRVLDLHLCRRNQDELAAAMAQAEQEAARLRSRQRSLEEQVESEEFGLAEQRRVLETVEQQGLEARQRMQDIKGQIDASHGRIEFNEERIREAGQLAERYQADAAAAEEKLQVQRVQLDETDQQLAGIFATLKGEEEQLQAQQTEVSRLRSQRLEREKATQELQRQIQQKENRVASLRGDLSSMVNQREAGETRLGLLQQELNQSAATRDHLAAQTAETRVQLEQAQGQVQQGRDDLKDAEHELANAQKELQALERESGATQRSLAERQSKLEVLRQLNEEGAGLGAGSQAVLKGLDNPQLYRAAIVGAVANFLEVPGDLIAAVEAALGQHMEAILVADPDVAEAMAGSLGKGRVGRAALLPQAFIQRHQSVQVEALPEGSLGWILDKIKVHPPVASLVNQLLGRVVLAPDLGTAFRIRQSAPDLAVATLNGEYISPAGLVFAGQAVEANQSIFQRKLQIRTLEGECRGIKDKAAELTRKRDAVAEQLECIQGRLKERRENAQRAQVHASSLQGQLLLLDRELREAEGKVKSLSWEKNNTEQRLKTAAERVRVVEADLNANLSQAGDLQERLAAMAAEADALRSHEDSLTEVLNELRVRVATERQRKENLQRQRQPIAVRLNELNDLLASRRRDIANYQERVQRLRQENEQLGARLIELESAQAQAAAEVARFQADRTQRIEMAEGVESSLRRLRKEVSECQDSRGQEEVKHTQLGLRLERVREHVTQRYQLDLSLFEPDWHAFRVAIREQRQRLQQTETAGDPLVSTPETDWPFVEQAVVEMTERLDAMGPVNLEAIQEYDELEERQRFLNEQQDDLTKSKAELLDVITKINATTKELFAGTFQQVRKNFQEMFVELFGGGKADLLLVDAADPLESGIEIIAKPPGKQLQSISLLSGGEKTMTAVALLFAVYMVKPSPFCVLDEMDAPLDESNINRFIKILDRFVSQSQFVVITHNKRTIAKADVLYGVTMEEHGISKLVGVRLTRREDADGQQLDLIGSGVEGEPGATPSIAESFGKSGDLHSEA